jgi:hypothetical protein
VIPSTRVTSSVAPNLATQDLGRDREVLGHATAGKFLTGDKLRETALRALGQACSTFAGAGMPGQLVHERAEVARVSDRYLKRLFHRS